jgi:hypothetical protein
LRTAITISTGIRLVGTIRITTGGRVIRGLVVIFEGVFDFVNDVRHDGQEWCKKVESDLGIKEGFYQYISLVDNF